MKKILLTFLALIFVITCTGFQPIERPYLYEKIVNVNGEKAEIYSKSLEWFAEYYFDSKAVIEYKDLENGKIMGYGFSTVPMAEPQHIRYTIIIEVKDNKYRMVFKNLRNITSSTIIVKYLNYLEPEFEEASLALKKYILNENNNKEW